MRQPWKTDCLRGERRCKIAWPLSSNASARRAGGGAPGWGAEAGVRSRWRWRWRLRRGVEEMCRQARAGGGVGRGGGDAVPFLGGRRQPRGRRASERASTAELSAARAEPEEKCRSAPLSPEAAPSPPPTVEAALPAGAPDQGREGRSPAAGGREGLLRHSSLCCAPGVGESSSSAAGLPAERRRGAAAGTRRGGGGRRIKGGGDGASHC
jgi:hypothetical protein